ncbi:hypothetical protein VZT92_014099 [Zoarces viviparus]
MTTTVIRTLHGSKWRSSEETAPLTSLTDAAMATRAEEDSLSALRRPSMQFTSQRAEAMHPFPRTYAPAEEFRCQETSTACACISYTSKSSGIYISKSRQLGVEIHRRKEMKHGKLLQKKRVQPSSLGE